MVYVYVHCWTPYFNFTFLINSCTSDHDKDGWSVSMDRNVATRSVDRM